MEEGLQLGLVEMQSDDSLKSQNTKLPPPLPNFYKSLDNDKFPLT